MPARGRYDRTPGEVKVNGANRMLSFGAGPARWPEAVLRRAKEGLDPARFGGLSVLEIGHRGPDYARIHEEVRERLRRLLAVPEDREILLLPGGATMQFAMLPLNLRRDGRPVDVVLTGRWAEKALEHARASGPVRVAASGKEQSYRIVPPPEAWAVRADAAYLHVTTNNTVFGTRLARLPEDLPVPLVGDASSEILAAPLPVSRFAVLYAGAQKCLGPAGLAVVVIRRDLLEAVPEGLPPMLSYRAHAAAGSRLNTPPTALVWLMGLMLEWIEEEGGAEEMHRRTRERAALVYEALDRHPEVYEPVAAPPCRSLTNVVFRLRNPGLQPRFLEAARAAGLVGLAGHRSVGGLRASMYTGMPVEGARRLAEFLDRFAADGGAV
ncbi:MAG: 3-phosphoserine/phosphohydroxythreonine transaminase [Acidobacteria bacterium]|nr:MAG: 3-phosphoserine/phosphohydroxythreonine transaminase [Acidobacteriota bacterium]